VGVVVGLGCAATILAATAKADEGSFLERLHNEAPVSRMVPDAMNLQQGRIACGFMGQGMSSEQVAGMAPAGVLPMNVLATVAQEELC
jgi:hypothetical protein